jgi:hypothetical protein
MIREILRGTALLALAQPLMAQAPDDGAMLSKRTLMTSVVYSHDSWNQYWEGTRKRSNDNIGTLTTQMVTASVAYGITNRLGIAMSLPYVKTEASQGTLHGMQGIQDLSIAAKFRLLTTPFTNVGALSAFISGTAAAAVGDYSPDLPPVAIGTSGQRSSARFTLGFQSKTPFYANASAAYTFCNNVKLDRPSYYTDGVLYMTNEVAMPNLSEYTLGVGYSVGKLALPVTFVQQRTHGGGDIRRQDMPFISNRMDFLRVDAAAIYGLQKNVALRLGVGRVLNGRNVGQATTFNFGVAHALSF